jgi:hypothetical protein
MDSSLINERILSLLNRAAILKTLHLHRNFKHIDKVSYSTERKNFLSKGVFPAIGVRYEKHKKMLKKGI